MIVRILSHGSSFQGLATYLTHDAEAETAERVGWTHTLNCANDHVLSAVINEMLWTARDAELLKQEAGIRAGGRATESTVKHLSLNWAPDEQPTREHMTATTEDFLRHMHWDEHQAVLVAHTDKDYAHVHVMLNMVHPETGLKLDDAFEKRRASSWAENYEREHGGVRCENRLRNIGEREPAPTRPAWQAFQAVRRDFEEQEQRRAAQADRETAEPNTEMRGPAAEWEALRKMQRDERLCFFAEGKQAFSEMRGGVFREVREEFRPRWADYYAAKKDGTDGDVLKEMKTTLVNEQKAVLEERRDQAYSGLREEREVIYQELLAGQREHRQGLAARQAAQFDSLDLMDLFRTDIARPRNDYDRTVTDDQSWRQADSIGQHQAEERTASVSHLYGIGLGNSSARSGADAGSRIADGFAMAIFQLFEVGANAFSAPSAPEKLPAVPADEFFAQAAADARAREHYDSDRGHAREEEERLIRPTERSQQ
jgi:hypothetical protein